MWEPVLLPFRWPVAYVGGKLASLNTLPQYPSYTFGFIAFTPTYQADLGFNPEQSAIYTLRAELMSNLRKTIRERKWTQEEAAKVLNIGQSRVSDLMRGKWEKFSLDMLITLAIRVGKRIGITVV
ncbi:MAG: hypothetical protein JNIBNLAF_00283 [Nitrosomonas europaea]|uniref:helix-turn-helix domain-containing protein n=2 Tax=Nitrosomonas europaea TaxID=915 RepID=UPI003BB73FE5|nr:hypothetical protein [Nitrosomonas europaea]